MQAGKTITALAGVALLALVNPAQAALVSVEADTVFFEWDTNDVDAMYGLDAGDVSNTGNLIQVTPIDFRAESTDAGGTVITSGTGTIHIIPKSGYVVSQIMFGEIGDYRMADGATGASVDVDPWLRAFDDNALHPSSGRETTISNVPVTGDLTIANGDKQDWSASGTIDSATSTWMTDSTRIGLTLQNTLTATSTVFGEFAEIEKKSIGTQIGVVTEPATVIPVPAAVWLFGSGLLGLVGIARRRAS